jgi:hypothetical protein
MRLAPRRPTPGLLFGVTAHREIGIACPGTLTGILGLGTVASRVNRARLCDWLNKGGEDSTRRLPYVFRLNGFKPWVLWTPFPSP